MPGSNRCSAIHEDRPTLLARPAFRWSFDRGVVVYVGTTGNLRCLRQHPARKRGSSVLHEQVGHLVDKPGYEASAADIARCEAAGRAYKTTVVDTVLFASADARGANGKPNGYCEGSEAHL